MLNTIKKMFGALLICAFLLQCEALGQSTQSNTSNKKGTQTEQTKGTTPKKEQTIADTTKKEQTIAPKEVNQKLQDKKGVTWIDWLVIIMGSCVIVLGVGFFLVKIIVKDELHALFKNISPADLFSLLTTIKKNTADIPRSPLSRTNTDNIAIPVKSIQDKMEKLPSLFQNAISDFYVDNSIPQSINFIVEKVDLITKKINCDAFQKALETIKMEQVDKDDMAAFTEVTHGMRANVIAMMKKCLECGVTDLQKLEERFTRADNSDTIKKQAAETKNELVQCNERMRLLEQELRLLQKFRAMVMPDELKDDQGLQQIQAIAGDVRINAVWAAFLNLYWLSQVSNMKPTDIKQGFIKFDELLYAILGNDQQELAKIRHCFCESINTNVLGKTPYSVKWPALESNLWPNPDFTTRNWYNCEAGNGNIVAKVRSAAIFKDDALEAPARISSR